MIHWNQRTPADRFRLLLAGAIFLFSLTMSLVLYLSIDSYLIRDTARNTSKAVQHHFSYLFGNLFAHHHHAEVADEMDKVIRGHFDIYDIVDADFYRLDGTIVYSYHPSRIGQPAANEQRSIIQSVAQTREYAASLDDDRLGIWMAVRDEHTGDLLGAVHIVRDIRYKKELFYTILSTCLLALCLCGAVLYFSLKRVYDRSTEQLEENAARIREMLGEIASTYDASLQALSSALDSRDNETNGHSFRVTAYTIRLAREIGVGEQELADMIRGALLHDVGKIGVPDAILLKQGPLTSEEWHHMRRHVEIGYEMLRHIPFLQNALEIVRNHHERWDGNGYPYGLKGNAIPLSARIFAICDTYDAITSTRPYRKSRSHEEAVAEIAAQAGRQFDPQVVNAFLRIPRAEWIAIGKQATYFHENQRQFEQLLRVSHANASQAV